MDSLKTRFEKALKTKLLYKTSGHMTEEVLLLKNFKYFDEDETNNCDIDTFLRVVAKVGVLSLSEEELIQIFNYYSKGKKYLNYKDFVSILYNNQSLKDNKANDENEKEENMEQPQQQEQDNEEKENNKENEEIDHVDELILNIRNRLTKRGLLNLINIESRFRELDEDNTQELDIKLFTQICTEFDFGLTHEEIEELFVSFDKDERGMINYDDFIRVLRGELNENRKNLIHNVFKHLDIENKGNLSLEELLNIYQAKNSFECHELNKTEQEAFNIFEQSLKGNHKYLNGDEAATKNIDIEEFEDFYESVSLMISDDDLFKEIVLRTWGLIKDEPEPEEEEINKEEKAEEENNIEPNEEQEINNNQENNDNIDDKENEEENEKEEINKKNKIVDKEIEFRKEILKEENIDIFRDKLGAKGIITVTNFVAQLKQYDRKGDKELPYSDFVEIIQNTKVIISEEEILDLFSDFCKENDNIINYEIFLNKLFIELNPRRENIVKVAFDKLDTEKGGIINLSDIKTFFSSKNCPLVSAALMSEEEFYNSFIESFLTHHNLYRSAKIKKVNYNEFYDYYKFFSITVNDDYLFEETVISSWKLSKDHSAFIGPKDNVKEIIGNPALEKPNNEEVKNLYKSAKKCFPQKNKIIPFGVDEKPTDYSNQLHPKGELNGIKLNKNDDIISLFRKKIISRGFRGIMSLRRTFMLLDENKSNKLKRKQFHKFLEDYRYDIPTNLEEKLFQIFDKNKTSSINYNEFISAILGKMNDFRRQIVQKAFEKLDKEKKGIISYDILRENYNVDKHPEVLNGKRTKQEVLARFIDMIEYHFNLLNHGKNKKEVTEEDFEEFYNYISIFIDNDKYFENLMSRVWGLNGNENFGKVIKFVKYINPYI